MLRRIEKLCGWRHVELHLGKAIRIPKADLVGFPWPMNYRDEAAVGQIAFSDLRPLQLLHHTLSLLSLIERACDESGERRPGSGLGTSPPRNGEAVKTPVYNKLFPVARLRAL